MSKTIVITDTSVLINLLVLDRAALLGQLPDRRCVDTDHVRAEVAEHHQERLQRLELAFSTGILEEISVTDLEEVQFFARLTATGLGTGECSAIAVAAHRKFHLAVDDKRAIKKVAKLAPELQILTTEALMVLLIQHEILTVAQADAMKLDWDKDFGGKPWKGRAVYDLLTDKKYIGKIDHKGKAYDGEHAAIVKTDLFEKVQEVLSANKTYTHKHQVERCALLRRMLRCGECGSMIQPAWTNNHGRQYRYYTCSKGIKAGYKKCKLPTLPAGEIETLVVDQLRALLRHPDVIARTYREIQERSEAGPNPELVGELTELHQRREQI